jgi:hypothetical protein
MTLEEYKENLTLLFDAENELREAKKKAVAELGRKYSPKWEKYDYLVKKYEQLRKQTRIDYEKEKSLLVPEYEKKIEEVVRQRKLLKEEWMEQ